MLAGELTNEKTYEFEKSDASVAKKTFRDKKTKCYFITGIVAGAILLFLVGFLVGYFVNRPSSESCHNEGSDASERASEDFRRFHEMFRESISKEELESTLRDFSSQPHIAGSERQRELAENLSSRWESFGFDKVEMPEYKVLLSFPQPDKPNKVSIVENGAAIYEITGKIKIAPAPNSTKTFDHYPYLAYAHNGTVEGDLVYANKGQDEDFKKLAELNITVQGKIVIIRSRNVDNAEKHGAIGALVYADPEFSAQQGYDTAQVYPNGEWLPPSGVQEGSILFGPYLGDPLTPVLPAVEGMYRRRYNASELPKIPAQPISYGQAMGLLRRLGGIEAPATWRGGLNITYRIGPGFQNSNAKVRLEINNQLQLKTIFNVIGTIYGKEDPDRYVIVGNHRDSWSFGAVDALSGTTVTNEIARVLGSLLEEGWRPRRTIKVCSWGGEEFNLIGSHEWVEENAKILTERAVAYINLDIAVCGSYVLRARASPLFKEVTYKWAKEVKDPNEPQGSDTVYDNWLKRTPSDTNSQEPMIYNLFSGSDYASFYQYLGVPCGDFGYWFGYGNASSLYPTYHTQQDTFYWLNQFVDQEFETHKAMTLFGGGMLLDFADQPILPLDVLNYAATLNNSYHILASSPKFAENNITLLPLHHAILEFLNTSREFETRKSEPALLKNPSQLRMINDQLVKVEMAFIHPYGLPGKPQDRHVAFNYGFHNIQSSKATFPGVTEALYLAESSGDWDLVRRQLSVAVYSVRSASRVLQPLSRRMST